MFLSFLLYVLLGIALYHQISTEMTQAWGGPETICIALLVIAFISSWYLPTFPFYVLAAIAAYYLLQPAVYQDVCARLQSWNQPKERLS